MICELFGLEAANASLYDGGTALAEAVLLARGATRRSRVIIPGSVHPFYRQVTETLTRSVEVQVDVIPDENGSTDRERVLRAVDSNTAALVLQYPNFFGIVEEIEDLIEAVHGAGGLAIVVADPMAMGVLEPPGALGADIVVGEGQGLGNPQAYGGPYLGLFAAREKFARRMPGRIVGVTKDVDGRRGFVLTLQTREQHIRRDKATSNICTNEGLCATRATFYMSMLGPQGLRDVGEACLQRRALLQKKIAAIPGFMIADSRPRFKEFVVTVPHDAVEFCSFMIQRGVLPGIPLAQFGLDRPRDLLVAVTECRTEDEIRTYAGYATEFSREHCDDVRATARAHAG